MKTAKKSVDPNILRELIRSAGLRCTAARLTVLKHLSEAGAPVSHADVCKSLTSHGFDRATVYRNLTELTEAGVLSRVELGDHVWRFEVRGLPNHPDDHPHFVCVDCGEVSCLDEVRVTVKPQPGRRAKSFGTITDVLLKGRCPGCA